MADNRMLILDGAMGTMLQAAGLPAGQLPELWNLTHPETVAAIHRRYVEAGSRVLYTNTFGANRLKAAGCGHSPAELVTGAVRCAREAAAGRDVKVALDIGPIGRLLEPLGDLSFDEAYDIFKELIAAGESAGADLVVIETMSDLYEVKAAVLAAKENSRLPVWVTMTFEATGRSFRPEFLNRLDDIVFYKPLTREDIKGIIVLMLRSLSERLAAQQLKLNVTDEAKDYIALNGYDPVYGARPLRRFIQRTAETLISRTIITGNLRPGQTIRLDADEDGLKVSVE